MKIILATAMFIILGFATAVIATIAPENEPTERVIPNTSHAVIGKLVSCTVKDEPGIHMLVVEIEPIRSLWGDKLTITITTKYKEYLPAIPKGVNVWFLNYTGSGIEWEAKQNQQYICFLKQEKEGFTLLRLEPIANETKVMDLYNKQKNPP